MVTRGRIVEEIFDRSFPSWWSQDGNTYSLIYGMSGELKTLYDNVTSMHDDIFVNTAQGSKLDDIGKLFRIARNADETDAQLRGRIQAYWVAFTNGGTSDGITSAIALMVGIDSDRITINEQYIYYPVMNLEYCEATTGWTATDDATNLTSDTSSYWQGAAGLNFDGNAGTDVNIRRTYSPVVDLSDYSTNWFSFSYQIATLTNLTRLQVTFTDSSGNYETYYNATTDVSASYQRYHIDLNRTADASSGTLDWDDITYIDVTSIYSAANSSTDFRCDYVTFDNYDRAMRIKIDVEVDEDFDLTLISLIPDVVDNSKAAGIWFGGTDDITYSSANNIFLLNLSSGNGEDTIL